MSTPIRFSSDRVITREQGGLAEGSQEAAQAIERVKQQLKPKKGRTPQGITLVDTTRPPKKKARI